jgi:hypothetical protein
LRRQFVDSPVLVMPGAGRGLSNSLGAVVIPDVGTIYFGAYRQTGEWGALGRTKAYWSRPMAARVVCRHPRGATTSRLTATVGRSRPRRDGWFAKEHGDQPCLINALREDCPFGRSP